MVDVDKLTDAELRTKLLEYGFPVMPITGTTRKVMAKKLKLLLENEKKVASSDGRRSLGRYSSEEESDSDAKSLKKERNRRATMAAPVSTSKISKKSVVEPEVVNSSPKKRDIRTSVTSTRSQKIVKVAQDEFDTGSDSESDLVASSNKYDTETYDTSSKYDSFNDVEYSKRVSPAKALSNSFSRYSPPKTEDSGYTRRTTFSSSSSPSRYTSVGGSLASDYAADRLNQIRSRLSLSSSGYDKPATTSTTNHVALDDNDTPFLSNFTKKLSALNASKKTDFDSKTDFVKEQDTNGSSFYGKSYLSNFKSNRNREPAYDYKSRDNNGKSNFVSFAVLACAALFFVFLAVVYLGMKSDTSVTGPGYNIPLCSHNEHTKNCIKNDDVQNAIDLLTVIKPELHKRSVAHRCHDATIKPQMIEAEVISFCVMNYAIKDDIAVKNDLRNLEIMIFANPEWGISIAQTEDNNGAVFEGNVVKDIDQMVSPDLKLTSLVILNPEVPYRCSMYNLFTNALYVIMVLVIIFAALYGLSFMFKIYKRYMQKQKNEVNSMVEKIIDILQNSAAEESSENYVVINHVRDMILNVKDRKAKQKYWEKAVQYINENESRVRTEVQTVHGESFDVWRWIGSANLSMSGDASVTQYRPGRRIVDAQYLIDRTLRFPHRALFFCSSSNVQITKEVREGFFSILTLKCNRCYKEYNVCSEEPKKELLNVNLALVAGILSLGLDLYQLNEICSSVHMPPISGDVFQSYVNEIREIYHKNKCDTDDEDAKSGLLSLVSNDSGIFSESSGIIKRHGEVELISSTPNDTGIFDESNSSRLINTTFESMNSSINTLNYEERKRYFLKELERDIDKIEESTRGQKNDEVWFCQRRKRLTASNFGRIYKLLDKTNRANTVKSLLYSTFKGTAATRYGQDNEDEAIELFELITGKVVAKSGLVIHKDYPFLAASPDGIIFEENALVEVKCPYKARNSILRDAFDKKEIEFATYTNGILNLKREDKYYYQVQGQLHVTGRDHCYFIVWTPQDIAFQKIEKDQECWDRMFPKLERFYFDHLLPELLKETI
ncbi:uncharacterized protein LOC143194338 isoform X1 [Rhynchophorus ferrugineus]|uniref:uncharacterized protein LOC143194338 isoform X1 n=1 Tax=Rhynchophorus ferrugineus TaxID=354439 RepID=UPI003FCCFB38